MAITRKRDYSDLDLDFIAHPTTGDIVKKTGPDAVKRSIRNIIFTNFYERKFRHYLASGATGLLFENATPITAGFLKDAIITAIENYEPRAKLYGEDGGVTVSLDPDSNGYYVRITFVTLNSGAPVSFGMLLERVR